MHWDKLLTIFVMSLFVISFASAWEWDNNVRSYDKESETVIINDWFGAGGDLVKIQLMENTYECLTDCYAILNVTIYDDEDNFLGDLVFEKLKGEGVTEHKFEYVSSYENRQVQDYRKDCSRPNSQGQCEMVEDGTHTEVFPVYTSFNPERKLPVGNFILKISGKKGWADTVDWIPTIYGMELRQWAFWASTDPTSYWNFNEVSAEEEAIDFLGLNNMTRLSTTQVGFAPGKLNNAINMNFTALASATFNTSGRAETNFGTNDFTIAYWINGSGIAGHTMAETNVALSTGWGWGRQSGGVHQFSSNNAAVINTVLNVSTNDWNRVVWVRSGTGADEFRVYVNGDNTNNGTLAGDLDDASHNFTINTPNTQGYTNLDDLQMYNGYAWSVTDVAFDYNGGAGLEANTSSVPAITLTTPADSMQQISSSVLFNCSATGDNRIINVTLYLDGLINSTESGNATTIEFFQTIGGIGTGSHNWTCVSRDETNAFGETSNRTFSITEFAENSQTFNATTYETSTEAFIINVSFNSSEFPVSTATLNYNGTGYSGSTSDTGDNKTYTTAVTVPQLIVSDNLSFYWSFILTNATGNNYFNSTTNNQSVGIINASIKGSPYQVTFLNFTTYDQENLTRIVSSIASTLEYGISSIIQNLSYSDQTASKFSFEFAFDPPHLDYLAKGSLAFSKANYVTNNYVLGQQTITNATTNVSIYLLNSSKSTSFIVQVRDSAFDNVAGAVVESQRFYPSTNTWTTVESFKTNIEGKTIGHFVVEDVSYRFLVYVDTLLVLTSTPTLVFCENTPCTINLQLPSSSDSAFGNFENLDDYSSSLSYSKTTETFTFTYADTQSDTQGGRLRVVRTNLGTSSNVEICNDVDGSGTGVLTCDVSSETNGTYIATGYSNRTTDENRITERVGIAKIRDIVSELGIDGLLWSAIFFVAIALLWLISPAVAIVGSMFALVSISLLGLISIPMVSLFALIAVAAMLLWVITR